LAAARSFLASADDNDRLVVDEPPVTFVNRATFRLTRFPLAA
jgi:hypothetical protein